MAAGKATLWMGVSLLLVLNVHCEDDIGTVIKRIDNLDETVIQIQKNLPRVEERVLHRIASAKLSLKSDLKQNIQQLVRDAMLEILQGESVEEMVRSQVVTQVRQLKQSHENMKRELSRLWTLVNNSQAEKMGGKEKSNTEIQTETYLTSVESLKSDLDQCNQQSIQKDEDIADLRQCFLKLNQTCQLRRTEDVSTLTTSTSTTVTTPSTTTPNPNARNRIMITTVFSSKRHRFHGIDMTTSGYTPYIFYYSSPTPMKAVTTVSYMSKKKKLLIARRNPYIIISADMNSNDITTLLTGVISYGMAVDDELGIIFMTTDHPVKTISRMTTEGEDFTTVRDVRYKGNYPRAIAINPKEELIYACNHNKVFVVSYDGTNLQTLARGSEMFALTLDDTGSVLYFNNYKRLMKMSLPGNKSEEVLSAVAIPWSMVYYDHRVYFTTCCLLMSTLYTVNVRSNPVSLNTTTVYMDRAQKFSLCLVP